MTADEQAFLDEVARTYQTHESHQDEIIRSLAVRIFKPHIPAHARGLELGCDDGKMTVQLSPLLNHLTVVDGSAQFIELAKRHGITNATFVHSLFEEFKPARTYDCIFACYVLEHVQDSLALLKQIAQWLTSDGRLFIVVPNARAMSRQLARHMRLLDDLYALTPNDLRHGHRRVYDLAILNREISESGLEPVAQGGLMLKPLADFQMNEMFRCNILGGAQVEGLYQMGLEYPDLAGSLFSVCRISTHS